MTTAVVVGSGPNGLAAAIVLAGAGLDVTVLEAADDIGGGTRSAELTLPGLVHDVCAATHPTALASPFLRSLDLGSHGLEWAYPEIDVAHPLDGGRAGVLVRDLATTAEGLGADAAAWTRTFAPFVDRADDLVGELFAPIVHVPRHPLLLARFGPGALQPATWLARRFETDEARGLFAGLAGHAVQPLGRPTTGALGLMFGVFGHAWGWPVAKGGSAAIASALESVLRDAGGRVETGHCVTDLPDADVVMLDTAPRHALAIAGERVTPRAGRALRRWRHGPGVFKVDLAVEGGVPWTHEAARRAGTVHVGGTIEEIAAAERDVTRGRMPSRPFVLVCQQYLADPSRSVGDLHPVWAYAHVPHGYAGDATEAVMRQIERFAPGVRERVRATAVRGAVAWEQYNPNYVGGDITGGANDPWQVVMRPRMSPSPYRLGAGVYLCSSSTPPGGGVHGMSGFHAATLALRDL